MRGELSHSVEVENATIDNVLPGVISNLNSLEQAVRRNTEEMRQGKMEIDERIGNLSESMPTMIRDTILETWQSFFSGMTTMVGDMRLNPGGSITSPAGEVTNRGDSTVEVPNALTAARVRSYVFVSSHNNLQGLWDEWYGLGDFLDSPIPGGVAKLEELYGAKWRKKCYQQRVSRQGRICRAILQKSDDESKTVEMVCSEWDDRFVVTCNKNMRRFVQFLQSENWIETHARRGRNPEE